MKTQYIIRGYNAFSEQDSFENGCFGPHKTEFINGHEWTTKANTLKELLAKLTDEFRSDDFLLDSCEEEGRLDLQAYHLRPFKPGKMSDKSVADWKAGKIDAWLTTYTFYVEKVVTGFCLTDATMQEYNEGAE